MRAAKKEGSLRRLKLAVPSYLFKMNQLKASWKMTQKTKLQVTAPMRAAKKEGSLRRPKFTFSWFILKRCDTTANFGFLRDHSFLAARMRIYMCSFENWVILTYINLIWFAKNEEAGRTRVVPQKRLSEEDKIGCSSIPFKRRAGRARPTLTFSCPNSRSPPPSGNYYNVL